jgi:hypothetical protein
MLETVLKYEYETWAMTEKFKLCWICWKEKIVRMVYGPVTEQELTKSWKNCVKPMIW